MNWREATHLARDLETQLEALLPESDKCAAQIQAALAELRKCVAAMSAIVQESPTTATAAVLQKYRDVVADAESEYKRRAEAAQKMRDRDALFKGANEDIEAGDDESLDPLLRERKSIGGALRGVADSMAQGLEARAALARQRQTLTGSSSTMTGMMEALPSVNDVISAMQRQQTRHNAVVGTTMGACACFLIWAVFLN